MNSWTKDLRHHSSVAFSPGSGRGRSNLGSDRGSPRSGSPRSSFANTGSTSYTKLLQITKDHESLCSHLMASTKQMQEQLSTLRVEHDALRAESQALLRCLDRAGVLPIAEVEKEKKSPTESTIGGSSGSLGLDTLVSNGPVHSQESTSEESPTRWPSLPLEQSDLSSRPGALASAALFAVPSSPESREQDSHLNSTLSGLSLDQSEPIAETSQDLYEICQPLLDRGTSMADQQQSLRLVTQYLKNNPEPPSSWKGPSTPLHASVKAGRVDLTRLLLRAKAGANERDQKGVSPLHLATFDGNTELCRTLLAARADVDLCDRHGQTSLFFAPSREVCKLLVEKKGDISVLNRKGQSALHLAGRAGLQEVLAWLSSRVTRPLLELKDVHGATARMYAMQAGLPPRETSDSYSVTSASRVSQSAVSVDSRLSVDSQKTMDVAPPPISSPGDEHGRLPSKSEAVMDQPLTPLDIGMSPNDGQRSSSEGSSKFGGYPHSKAAIPSYPVKKTAPQAARSPAQVIPRPLPKTFEAPTSPQKSRASSSSQPHMTPQSQSKPMGAYAAYRSDRKGSPKADDARLDPTAFTAPQSSKPSDNDLSAPQRFDMRTFSDADENDRPPDGVVGDSLEVMYDFDKTEPPKETVTALMAAVEVASIAVHTASELNREKELKANNDDLRDVGVLDDLEAVGVLEDVNLPEAEVTADSLREAGVLDGLEIDDSMLFEELTPNQDRERGDSDDLANEGVLDDLSNSGVLFDEKDLASEGVLDEVQGVISQTAPTVSSSSKADLAEIGVMEDDDDLADLGVLNDEDLAELGIGLPKSLDDCELDEKAALAEIGVLEDADDLAEVGVFEGDDDEALVAAGVFMGDLAPPRMALDSVPEEAEEEEEEEEEVDYVEEEEEEEVFDDDGIEECW